jgi:thiol-disulfide isomerase/thioredoxin
MNFHTKYYCSLLKSLTLLLICSAGIGASAQVEIYGIAKHYKDTVFYLTETGGFHNFSRAWRDNRVQITIDKEGQFRATVPEYAIGTWYIRADKDHIQPFELISGSKVQLIADFSKNYPLTAVGEGADDFNYSAFIKEQSDKYYEKVNYLDKIRLNNVDSVLACRIAFTNFKLQQLDSYRQTHHLSDEYYHWLRSSYVYEAYERTLVENLKQDSLDEVIVSKIMVNGIDDEYAAMNTAEYNDLVDFYVRYYFTQNGKKRLTITDLFSAVAEGNLLKGNTRAVYLTRFMASLFKSPDSVYSPLFAMYDKAVQDPMLKRWVINRRNEYMNPAQASGTVNVSESALQQIFRKYKGKVIYVDFWASWCVPCRTEMPNAAILKRKLKDKDVVFLYFGYNDSEKAWLNARQQLGIEGEHYLLNETMLKEADKLFGINGIPHYAIIDRHGNIVERRANRPGEVYAQLLALIER